jgi:hypothetical protein
MDRRSDPPTYLIAWNRHTLDHVHPVHFARCERDGLDESSMWLSEEDLEPDSGEPVVIEQPTALRTRPLDPKNEEDRLRAIFGLTSDDLVPAVGEVSLRRYHDYLAAHLTFPFEAEFSVETGPFQDTTYQISVTLLADADDWDEMYGLFCMGRQGGKLVEVPLGELQVTKKDDPNRQLIKDYSYWFWNWR